MSHKAPSALTIEAPNPMRNARMEESTSQQAQSPTDHKDDEVPKPRQDAPARATNTTSLETLGVIQLPQAL